MGSGDKNPPLLYLSIFLSAIGGFLFGYDTGVIAGAMPLVEDTKDFFPADKSERLAACEKIALAFFRKIRSVGGIDNSHHSGFGFCVFICWRIPNQSLWKEACYFVCLSGVHRWCHYYGGVS